ncbi:hypothetical protein GYO_2910 [Bacillus spizizenii TU-B-10]|uniref:Uncharacterized protein n=1 Tax=Bacillus spizizenii (strain DSM 15029 / JCM 12233 / NBRC 101239 / NRRL B-23049 / TU-B-10) TaxID=1052585 RepID=G4NXS7_BACS4|nr:hypothetical protein GYO_2910 [Bacillus spizizenii TU-B-10]
MPFIFEDFDVLEHKNPYSNHFHEKLRTLTKEKPKISRDILEKMW